MPALKFNQCDYDCYGKQTKKGFRAYCRKIDKMCIVDEVARLRAPLPDSPLAKSIFSIPETLQSLAIEAIRYDTAEQFSKSQFDQQGFAKNDAAAYLQWTTKQLKDRIKSNLVNIQLAHRAKQENEAIRLEKEIPLLNDIIALKIAKIIPDRDKNHSTLKSFWKLVNKNKKGAISHKPSEAPGVGVLTPKTRRVEPVETTKVPTGSPEQVILNILTTTPMHINEIVAATQLPPGKVASELVMLEMNDLIKRLPGAYFVRKGEGGLR